MMHPFWYDPFFYLFLVATIVAIVFVLAVMNILKDKQKEMKVLQQQHSAKIDLLRKDQIDKIDKIRHEVSQREEERLRQWAESEKEMMHVLSGVLNILDITETISKNDSEKILGKLDEINLTMKK